MAACWLQISVPRIFFPYFPVDFSLSSFFTLPDPRTLPADSRQARPPCPIRASSRSQGYPDQIVPTQSRPRPSPRPSLDLPSLTLTSHRSPLLSLPPQDSPRFPQPRSRSPGSPATLLAFPSLSSPLRTLILFPWLTSHSPRLPISFLAFPDYQPLSRPSHGFHRPPRPQSTSILLPWRTRHSPFPPLSSSHKSSFPPVFSILLFPLTTSFLSFQAPTCLQPSGAST